MANSPDMVKNSFIANVNLLVKQLNLLLELNTKFTDERIELLIRLSLLELEIILEDMRKGNESAIIQVASNMPSILEILEKLKIIDEELLSFTVKTDSSLKGKGTELDPLGISAKVLSDISTNSQNIVNLNTTINNLKIIIDNLPTINDIKQGIEDLTPERVFLSGISIKTTASGGTIESTTLSNKGNIGTKTSTVPVVSSTIAGLATSALYNKISQMQTQIDLLDNTGIVIIDNTLPSGATQAQLTTAWNASGNLLAEGSVIENWRLSIRWVYRSNIWNGPFSFSSVGIATSTIPGAVLSSLDMEENKGKIFVELDGSMSLLGYDAIIANIANIYRRIWSASVAVNLPYTANTNIVVPTYDVTKGFLHVFINGVRTDEFTKFDSTRIRISNNIGGTDSILVSIDYYNNQI